MAIDSLLQELGARTGLGALTRNQQGICRLVFDNEFVVDIEARDGDKDLSITSAVGPVEQNAGIALLRRLLATNLMLKQNGGASLAIDINRDEVVLCRQLPVEMLDYLTFERSLQTFLNHLQGCRAMLDQGDAGTSAAPPVLAATDYLSLIRV